MQQMLECAGEKGVFYALRGAQGRKKKNSLNYKCNAKNPQKGSWDPPQTQGSEMKRVKTGGGGNCSPRPGKKTNAANFRIRSPLARGNGQRTVCHPLAVHPVRGNCFGEWRGRRPVGDHARPRPPPPMAQGGMAEAWGRGTQGVAEGTAGAAQAARAMPHPGRRMAWRDRRQAVHEYDG